MPDRATYGLLP